jgi:outer membrane murein-binding lipoprotein Lpp
MAPDNGQSGRKFPAGTTLLLACVTVALATVAGCGRGKKPDEIAARQQALADPE